MKRPVIFACIGAALMAATASNAFGWGAARGAYGGAVYRGPMGGAAVRGPRGGAAVRGPYGGAAVRGPYGGAAVRAPVRGVAVAPYRPLPWGWRCSRRCRRRGSWSSSCLDLHPAALLPAAAHCHRRQAVDCATDKGG